jgi:hypothetical protein
LTQARRTAMATALSATTQLRRGETNELGFPQWRRKPPKSAEI